MAAIDMVTRYNQSDKPRVVQSHQIPGLAVKYFDVNGKFMAGGFKEFETQNEPSQFTPNALNYYDTELKQMVTPQSFVPLENGITLNRWTPDNKYNVPGARGF